MQVYAAQLDIVWHDKAANHAKVDRLLDRAGVGPGALIVLPEMFATGFSMDVERVADAQHETERFLLETARRRKVAVIGGIVGRDASGKGVNEAMIAFPDDRPPLRYQKMQPFTLGGEAEHYAAGEKILLFEWQGFQIAPFICYDLRFPEHFREAVRQGAHALAVIANWPAAREEHWATLLRARAIENLCYVIGVNRCGKDPKFAYSGKSQILGPRGGEIDGLGAAEGVLSASLNLPALLEWRKDFPALQDMRPLYR